MNATAVVMNLKRMTMKWNVLTAEEMIGVKDFTGVKNEVRL